MLSNKHLMKGLSFQIHPKGTSNQFSKKKLTLRPMIQCMSTNNDVKTLIKCLCWLHTYI